MRIITPGEIQIGTWIMATEVVKPQPNLLPISAVLINGMRKQKDIRQREPFLVLAIELPYIVVARITMEPHYTKIWDTRETQMLEVTSVFVRAYSDKSFLNGQKMLRKLTKIRKTTELTNK